MSRDRRSMFLFVIGGGLGLALASGDGLTAQERVGVVEPSAEPRAVEADGERSPPMLRRGGLPRNGIASSADGLHEGGFFETVSQIQVEPRLRPPWPGLNPGRPGLNPPRNDWQLGVYADDTDTGVVVTRVIRGSSASRAGIERGDLIIAVGGRRVGFVGREVVSLGHELHQQAGRHGDVLLLVQDVRSRGLSNLDVRLTRIGGGLQPFGTAN